MKASASFSNIPNDIIRDILLQLPVKSLIRFQCVCKSWRLLIQDDSDFKLSYRGQGRVIILSHESRGRNYMNSRFVVRSTGHDLSLQRHKWPFGEGYPLIRESPQYDIKLCYCNGLVLVVTERDLLLWNPSTKCSTKVLDIKRPYPYVEVFVAGLCYDSCTRDYKAILLFNGGFPLPFFTSASLNHKEWRPLVKFPYDLHSVRDGVNFRNTFHCYVVNEMQYQGRFLCNKIIYFDPMCDEFRILPTPEPMHESESLIVGLGVIDDCFCMAQREEQEPNSTKTTKIKVLIMKKYGRQESWMTAFVFQMPQPIETIDFKLTFYSLKKDVREIILFWNTTWSWGWRRYQVYVYDQKKDQCKEILMDFLNPLRRYIVSMCFYVESLVCPDYNGLLSQ